MAGDEELFQSDDELEGLSDSPESLFDESLHEDDLAVDEEEELQAEQPAAEGDGLAAAVADEQAAAPAQPGAQQALWPYGTKRRLFLTSLVAAIPAAVLAVLMVDAFLRYTDRMNAKVISVAALTLAASAVTALLPVAILIFCPKEAKPEKPVKKEPEEEALEETEQARGEEPESFGDVIPEDFDASEVQAAKAEEELEPLDVDSSAEESEEFTFDEDLFSDESEESRG